MILPIRPNDVSDSNEILNTESPPEPGVMFASNMPTPGERPKGDINLAVEPVNTYGQPYVDYGDEYGVAGVGGVTVPLEPDDRAIYDSAFAGNAAIPEQEIVLTGSEDIRIGGYDPSGGGMYR